MASADITDQIRNYFESLIQQKDSPSVSTDVVDCGDHFEVEFELPGLEPSQIELLVVDGALQIKAIQPNAEGLVCRQERKRGEISRSLILPGNVDVDAIYATMRSGLLIVALPKKPSQTRRIPILTEYSEVKEGESKEFSIVPVPSELPLEERFALCRSVGEECIQDDDLLRLLTAKENPICYDGFEPSGRMHIAQGILRTINVNRLTRSGCIFKFWVADWFALMNNKMGGDIEKIRNVGRYMIEIWKACGMDMRNVQFLWASEEINSRPAEYWSRVIDIGRRFNLPRILRCATIMGRRETDDLAAAQVMYPLMQCADIFFLKADICQLGMDQRKVNMLAREYCDEVRPKIRFKPVILSHHMLLGLKQGQEKMSKSDPDSAIFMEDSESDVKRKLRQAFCPEREVQGNPCLDYLKHIVFGMNPSFLVKRKEENGGDKHYTSYEEAEMDYINGLLHPGDLKPALADAINAMLQPVRDHFKQGEAAQLLRTIRSYKVTK